MQLWQTSTNPWALVAASISLLLSLWVANLTDEAFKSIRFEGNRVIFGKLKAGIVATGMLCSACVGLLLWMAIG